MIIHYIIHDMIDLVCPHILFFSETGQFISTSLVFKAQLADAQRESGLDAQRERPNIPGLKEIPLENFSSRRIDKCRSS